MLPTSPHAKFAAAQAYSGRHRNKESPQNIFGYLTVNPVLTWATLSVTAVFVDFVSLWSLFSQLRPMDMYTACHKPRLLDKTI